MRNRKEKLKNLETCLNILKIALFMIWYQLHYALLLLIEYFINVEFYSELRALILVPDADKTRIKKEIGR